MIPLRHQIASCLANERLHLILMPTESCNLRCTYCYEEFKLKRMQPSVVDGVKNLLSIRAPQLQLLEIAWFGGEPLLAMDVIEGVSRHVRTLRDRHPQLEYRSEMTTNAYTLHRARFQQLLDWGVTRFQITFDGPRDLHDRRRRLAGGGSTFDRIWANLVAAAGVAGTFTIVVRLHVDRLNHHGMPDFIRDYARQFGQDARFQLFIRPLARLGGPRDSELPVFGEQDGLQAVRSLSRYAAHLGLRHFTIEEHPVVCYAAHANSWVVRADGRLNKCTVTFEHPNNQVGRILANGHMEIDPTKMMGWMRGLWSGDQEELECPMHGYADPGTNSVGDRSTRVTTAPAPPLRFRVIGRQTEARA